MALVINHNLPAMRTARILGGIYDDLAKSIERLSSGLRINSAADDAAGLAVRELMRADIASGTQGIRNVADGISLIQTADGALSVIDQKLIRMKQLAEQAATGIYTDVQRELINSEYQSMAREIDRIANSTTFNGIKLLDGSVNAQNNGQGIRIHFGPGNTAESDYYYINTDDTRATVASGLRIGGDAKNDIWSMGPYGGNQGRCCAQQLKSLSEVAVDNSGEAFAYGYNWDLKANGENNLLSAKYLAGRYGIDSGTTYEQLIGQVNAGTQSRIGIQITDEIDPTGTGEFVGICLGTDEMYYWGDDNAASAGKSLSMDFIKVGGKSAEHLATAINGNADSEYWAMLVTDTELAVFRKDGGDYNGVRVETDKGGVAALNTLIAYRDYATDTVTSYSGVMTMGGEHWGTLAATTLTDGYSLALLGRDTGDNRDLWIASDDSEKGNPAFKTALTDAGITEAYVSALQGTAFVEVQDAADGPWDGAHIRTQEAAQRSLTAISEAIQRKDSIRANLGALQNLLESTMETLSIQVENLQAAESRISDVDVALEMTNFMKQNILAQAATAMLAQANSLSSLALTLIVGA